MTVIYSLATVLEYHSSTGTWKSHRVDLLGQNVTLPEVCYIFLDSSDWFNKHCPKSDRTKILAPFQAPDFLSNKTCTKLNGYFGSQSFFSSNDDDKKTLQSLSAWFRILTKKIMRPEEGKTEEGKDYLWYEMGFFTWWNSSTTCRVLCIGAPQEMNTELKTLLVGPQPPSFELQDPFAMLRPLFDEIIKLCDENTWRVAKSVRVIERNRRDSPDFEGLRNLARHTGHLVEVEQVAIETMEQLVGRQESNFKNLMGLTKTYEMQAKEYLLFQLQMMKSLRWRAQSTQDRLEEEITLAYNMLASSDNAIIKSITFLTMIFLPATFISALFSNTFFSFAENGWKISHKFWIYWVIVIPLTIIVLFGWWRWLGGSYEVIRDQWLHNRKRHSLPEA